MVHHCGDPNFIPKPVHVGFVVDKEALGQAFPPFTSVVSCIISFICH